MKYGYDESKIVQSIYEARSIEPISIDLFKEIIAAYFEVSEPQVDDF